MRVAVGGDNLKNSVVEIQDRDIKRAAAQVIPSHGTVLFLIESVSEGGGGGLVYQPKDLKARDAASVLCCLTLCVIEIRRNRDYGLAYSRAKVAFRVAL